MLPDKHRRKGFKSPFEGVSLEAVGSAARRGGRGAQAEAVLVSGWLHPLPPQGGSLAGIQVGLTPAMVRLRRRASGGSGWDARREPPESSSCARILAEPASQLPFATLSPCLPT